MATANFYNRFCKGAYNTNSGTKMTWWKMSFNMPVPDLYGGGGTWLEGSGLFTYLGVGTSFSLSGFEAGWEVVAAFTNFNLHGPFSGGNITCTQTWKNPSGTTLFTNQTTAYYPSLADSSWYEYQLGSNQGVAAWEISTAGTYQLVVSMSGSGVSASATFNVTFSNVPSVATYNPGKVWVEGSQLCYTSANGHIHRITGNTNGSVGSQYAGKIWCASGSNDIYWIGSDGVKYYSNSFATDYSRRTFRQIASYWSNGSPGQVYAGTGASGKTWMDSQYGYEHIGFIDKDGYKALLYSGNYPYTDPN